jgi:hypothetical protein
MEIEIFNYFIEVSKIVNSFGLLLDIIGAIILFKFGLPDNIDREGRTFIITSNFNDDEIKKAKSFDSISKIGLLSLILGFISQLISNWI